MSAPTIRAAVALTSLGGVLATMAGFYTHDVLLALAGLVALAICAGWRLGGP